MATPLSKYHSDVPGLFTNIQAANMLWYTHWLHILLLQGFPGSPGLPGTDGLPGINGRKGKYITCNTVDQSGCWKL